jgi:uncharacterized membrane protein
MLKQGLTAFAASALLFLALDACWLTLMGDRLYRPVLGDMMVDKPRVGPAIAFYVIYLGGLTLIATLPAVKAGDPRQAAVTGAMLGFVAYATYDLTNQATLRNWSTTLTLADLAWGTTVSALAAFAGFHAARMFGR